MSALEAKKNKRLRTAFELENAEAREKLNEVRSLPSWFVASKLTCRLDKTCTSIRFPRRARTIPNVSCLFMNSLEFRLRDCKNFIRPNARKTRRDCSLCIGDITMTYSALKVEMHRTYEDVIKVRAIAVTHLRKAMGRQLVLRVVRRARQENAGRSVHASRKKDAVSGWRLQGLSVRSSRIGLRAKCARMLAGFATEMRPTMFAQNANSTSGALEPRANEWRAARGRRLPASESRRFPSSAVKPSSLAACLPLSRLLLTSYLSLAASTNLRFLPC